MPSSGGTATVRIPASVEAQPIADLVVVDGPGGRQGTRIGLRAGQQKIGRDPERAEILLHDETISREHALIWQQDGSFYLQDENSTAGTFVNGNRITREALNDGDEITLGKTKLVFRSVAAR
jgi:pSer/pThr/pTyr-binding forkhead associated (FHA) protein